MRVKIYQKEHLCDQTSWQVKSARSWPRNCFLMCHAVWRAGISRDLLSLFTSGQTRRRDDFCSFGILGKAVKVYVPRSDLCHLCHGAGFLQKKPPKNPAMTINPRILESLRNTEDVSYTLIALTDQLHSQPVTNQHFLATVQTKSRLYSKNCLWHFCTLPEKQRQGGRPEGKA